MMKGLFEERVHGRALALLRILAGPIVLVHLYPFWERVVVGDYYFADAFFVPFFEWWPVLSRQAYVAVLSVGLCTALMMSFGVLSRLATGLTFAIVAFNVLSNQLFFHHNRAFLLAMLFGLALTQSGRVLSVDALIARRRGKPIDPLVPRWRLTLFRVLACTPYLASGFSKLIDPDWWSGTVMRLRIERGHDIAASRGVPEWLLDTIAGEGFNAVMWKFVVLTELFIGVGYWFRRTRNAAVIMALGFHVFIEVTSTVMVFSYLGIAGTLIWVVPKTRDRTLWLNENDPKAMRLEWLVRRLDWLARFDVRLRSDGPAIELIDRDGSKRTDTDGYRFACSRLPLLAPLYLPLLLLPKHKGDAQ